MAAVLRVRTKLPSIPSLGRSPPRELATSFWKREGTCLPPWIRSQTPLQPQRWQPDRFYRRAGPAHYSCTSSLSPASRGLEEPLTENTEQFKLVYKFPGIRYCRILSRMKLIQTGITIVSLPPIYYLYFQEQVSPNVVMYATGIACFAAIMLYSISHFLRRMIGLIYLNESGTTVKVAHLTFWGRKKIIYCPVETVMPLEATGDNKEEILFQFKQYNSTQNLYFTLKFGQIMDKQRFAQIFGESF